MRNKYDGTVFENNAVREMLETERSYNKTLKNLLTALTMDVLVEDNPLLLEFRKTVTTLKNISDALLKNARKTAARDLQPEASELLNNERTQLLAEFFVAYAEHTNNFDSYIEASRQYAVQFASAPENNPFYKIDHYLVRHGKSLGLDAHLIQPIQRGPRYSMLAAEAIKQAQKESERTGIPHETDNFRILQQLQGLVTQQLLDINAAKTQTEPSERQNYKFGDGTRKLISLYSAWASQSQAASSVPVDAPPSMEPAQPESAQSEPAQSESVQPESVQPEPATASGVGAEQQAAYKFGDYTRGFFRRFSKTDIGSEAALSSQAASSSQAAPSTPIPDPNDQDDGFVLLDTDDDENVDDIENNSPTKGSNR